MEYSILVQHSTSNDMVYQDTSAMESVMDAVVMVLPNEVYTVTVTVTTGGGMSSYSVNFTSPEAGRFAAYDIVCFGVRVAS